MKGESSCDVPHIAHKYRFQRGDLGRCSRYLDTIGKIQDPSRIDR